MTICQLCCSNTPQGRSLHVVDALLRSGSRSQRRSSRSGKAVPAATDQGVTQKLKQLQVTKPDVFNDAVEYISAGDSLEKLKIDLNPYVVSSGKSYKGQF